ncbi:MAG: hypothetical protein ACT4QC_19270 [Planctomycetaceae bacterium]
MSEKPQRRQGPIGELLNNRRLRWALIVAALLVLAYPLSTGPVEYFFFYGTGPVEEWNPTQQFFVTFYGPLYRSLECFLPIYYAHDAYNDFWRWLWLHTGTKNRPVNPPAPPADAAP